MASVTVFNDTMICGRAIMNDDAEADYLLACDGETWTAIDRPDTDDNNVRYLSNDGTYLYSVHNGGPMYYTDNMGKTWYMTEGLPEGLYPLTLAHDDDYIYSAVYSPILSETRSGLWRFPKAELKHSGVKSIMGDDNSAKPIYDGRSIVCGKQVKRVAVMLPDGKEVMSVNNVSTVDLSGLPTGIYIYCVDFGNSHYTGKVIKQ
ncbi:MAG: T9SS type A sorting domain-containing protein [Bacteroides sp.]|nr:T9SS type A sorting domain-containing protein [Bacteroides sp.]